jgi:hypothetical protein
MHMPGKTGDAAHISRALHIRPARQGWRPAHNRHRIATAIRMGTPDLDLQHKVTLLVFAKALDNHNLRQLDTRLRLGAAEIADRIGAPVSRIRWHIQNLCANAPTGPYISDLTAGPDAQEIYDLAPTLEKLSLMEEYASGRPYQAIHRETFR